MKIVRKRTVTCYGKKDRILSQNRLTMWGGGYTNAKWDNSAMDSICKKMSDEDLYQCSSRNHMTKGVWDSLDICGMIQETDSIENWMTGEYNVVICFRLLNRECQKRNFIRNQRMITNK